MEIKIINKPLKKGELKAFTKVWFDDMVKVVVDVKTGSIGVGGELHADAEALLIEQGSSQNDIWGANIYPERIGEDRIEYTALINIKPASSNRSMEIEDLEIKQKIKDLILKLVL